MGELEDLHERFGDRIAFVVVYIKEAHPEDGWVLTLNRDSGVAVRDPASDDDRAEVAQACAVRMRVSMPVAIDGIDNAVARIYGGWPDRLYLVTREGRVGYRSGPGPFGFRPKELERAIVKELRG